MASPCPSSDAHSKSRRGQSHPHGPGFLFPKVQPGLGSTCGTEMAPTPPHSRHVPRGDMEGARSHESRLRGPGLFSEAPVLRGRGIVGWSRRLRAGTYLGVVLSSGEEGQLIGSGEVGSDLLHLPETLPLPPLGPPVLEPDLQEKAVITGVRPQAGGTSQPPEPQQAVGLPISTASVFVLESLQSGTLDTESQEGSLPSTSHGYGLGPGTSFFFQPLESRVLKATATGKCLET